MLIMKKKFKSFRPNSADCKIERSNVDDKEAIHFCHRRYSISNLNLPKEIIKSPNLIGFESSFLLTNVIENTNGFSKLDYNLACIKLEKKLTLKMLGKLKIVFEGKHEVGLDEFKKIFLKLYPEIQLKDREVEGFFNRIDCFASGCVSWKSMCSYMQSICMNNSHSKDKEKDSFFTLPAKSISFPHREAVVKIIEIKDDLLGDKNSGKSFVCCSKDGIVSSWSFGDAKLKKSKRIAPPNSGKQKWVTDFSIMFQFYKMVLCTGDRELQFYDSSSFEPYCQIAGFATIPLRINYCYTGDDSCLLVFGDLEGCLNVLILNNVRDSLRSWKINLKEAGIPTVNIERVVHPPYVQFHRWKAHLDWVQQVRYSPELERLISCCESEETALVIGCIEDKSQTDLLVKGASTGIGSVNLSPMKVRQRSHETVFIVNKGVKCFDISKTRGYIITGGLDRVVRIWNPHMPGKPISVMKGHEGPVTYVSVSDVEGKIFTISLDKCILVWDLLNHCTLLSCRPRSHRIVGDIQACCYSAGGRCFVIATETVNLIRRRHYGDMDSSSSLGCPVNAIIYNYAYKQLIIAYESSMIKIWNIHDGQELFQFDASLNGHFITCLSLDNTCRRLFTGGSDGSISMWNYNNGELLRTLAPDANMTCEITDMTHVIVNDNKYLVSVGCSKQVTIYEDDNGEYKQHLHPLPYWPDDLAKGHEDDIVSVTFCPCNLLVTSSCDGVIIVWNFVSGHRIWCMTTPSGPMIEKGSDHLIEGRITKNANDNDDDDDDRCNCDNFEEMIPRVLFLTSHCNKPLAGNLVSLGSKGRVHFWNVHKSGGSHVTSFCNFRDSGVSSLVVMATDSSNQTLALGDSHGYVHLRNIVRFPLEKNRHDRRPPLLARWRAHTEKMTGLQLVEGRFGLFVVTSSVDGRVRIWNEMGHFVGTFDKKELWILSRPSTYIHPRVPHDVLIHPLSLPNHPLLPKECLPADRVIFGEDYDDRGTANHSDANDTVMASNNVKEAFDVMRNTEDEELVDKILYDKEFVNSVGKRLRYEITKPNPPNAGIPTIYGYLKVHDLEPIQCSQILKKRSSGSL